MPGLLDLPSELLFEIIGLIASSPYPCRAACKRYRPTQMHSRAVVCFPTTDPSWPSHTCNILLTCRRLHHEAIVYLSKASRAFELDVAIVNNHWIWPTWRYIPVSKTGYAIESLKINLTYCCTEDERASSETATADWPTSLEFMKVIGHFLRCGVQSASFESTGMPKRGSHYRVKLITINLDTASIRAGNDKVREQDVPLRQVQGLGHLTFDPLYFIDVATCRENVDRLSAFINMAMPRLDDGSTIRERVDKIVFSLDSLIRSEINIAKKSSGKAEVRIAEYRRRKSMQ
ncbi:hypothetical protein BDU57DRAFT_12961 [Ampelomyces quisqualis]|uniref:F-box domain-containing protein n=1 Tax=Ampelomyces quisqualis TaxID=50730 RepID=A0A6A5QZW7_AMPQU|nr:hypothetical protein BDU57DRAFT_12961 [Ampelomyces quisqualis]